MIPIPDDIYHYFSLFYNDKLVFNYGMYCWTYQDINVNCEPPTLARFAIGFRIMTGLDLFDYMQHIVSGFDEDAHEQGLSSDED
jgi:hypothetical protein